jgi:8-hydroxy-5-deazaflavin:NADPH oxidoreductase
MSPKQWLEGVVMKIAILGSGTVAQTLGTGLLALGHQVMLGTSAAHKLDAWASTHSAAKVGSFADAAAFAELVILAVKGHAALQVVQAAGPTALAGKTIIDTNNPIADVPPINGVLTYFTGPNESLMERLQSAYPALHFVKAFNSVGAPHMVQPKFAGGPPSMFIAGNNAAAKAQVTTLLQQLGWEAVDMGMVQAARAIEPLCMLWCIPGMLHNQWGHAFKLLKKG